jgi:hypothetical protein
VILLRRGRFTADHHGQVRDREGDGFGLGSQLLRGGGGLLGSGGGLPGHLLDPGHGGVDLVHALSLPMRGLDDAQ